MRAISNKAGMTRAFCGIWAILFLLASLCGSKNAAAAGETGLQAQDTAQGNFEIQVDVTLVTTDVTVIGAAVSELRAEDFQLFDDGVSQQVSHFSRDLMPLAVALLIDTSLSVQPYMPVLQIAAVSALRQLRPEDQVALFSFNAGPMRVCAISLRTGFWSLKRSGT